MRRFFPFAGAAVACACGMFASAASAATVELGATRSPLVAPSCPSTISQANCTIVLPQVTALETIRDGRDYPTTATANGYIVAFTVGLSSLSTSRKTALEDLRYLDRTYGGTTQARLTVLAPVKGKGIKYTWKLVAESPVYHLQPYLGQVVQFPLQTALPIAKGDTVALTVPTWAPVLSINEPMKSFAYRQSRQTGCGSAPATGAAQQTAGTQTQYKCDYPGTRVEYSATEITSPTPTPNYVR